MKQNTLILLFIIPISILFSQKEILKEDIFLNWIFDQDQVRLNSMNDGIHYTTLELGDTISIEKHSYQSGKKVDVLLKSSDVGIKFRSYNFNTDENLILLETESEKIYRYSKKGIYYVYNTVTQELQKISDKKIRLPRFSPNSKYISYVYRNNIYRTYHNMVS